MINKYSKLNHPTDSAFGRVTWRTYTPSSILSFIDGIYNIIRWVPTLYRDKDWDDYFINKVIEKKLEHQRAYLIHANRHVGLETTNRDMTLALNLIDRMNSEYYSIEYFDFVGFDTFLLDNGDGSYRINDTPTTDNLDEYFAKYPNGLRLIKKAHPEVTDRSVLAIRLSRHNEEKCRRIFWKLMNDKVTHWWD